MEVEGDLIWGNDSESEVFAEAHDRDRCIIFRYSWNPKSPESLATRIVTCYHNLPVEDPGHTFPEMASMREALWSSIREVWNQCTRHPSITAADITVEIYEDAQGQYQWRISHESLYNQYTASLLPVRSLFRGEEAKLQERITVDYSSLVPIRHLGGRGRTALVTSSEMLYVFKGVDFGTFLESPTDFTPQREVCYHEIRTMSLLPPHPNIMPPPNTLVTAKNITDDRQDLVCGALYPFMSHGTIDDQIESAKATGIRLPPICKATWCFQMASAIAYTHFTGHTFHMDIKLSNFLLETNRNLLLIDWEQSGAALHTLAPEADGSWDVKEVAAGSSSSATADPAVPRLVYDKYDGPYRENLAWGRPKWNVFPGWRDTCPRALDAAEVFSLGRCMWMLMDEVTEQEIEECDEIVVSWSEDADDIPEDWKDVVNRCLAPDPNYRIALKELVDFWKTVPCKDGARTEFNMV
ncbi:MAG: hypothetical protein LQ348_007076 [Seirophora lacunosa]|nr:MAG: hypothetical protein LQ348_007076 [Seirophora lacunosa]